METDIEYVELIIEDFKELDKKIIPKTEIGKILLKDISKL